MEVRCPNCGHPTSAEAVYCTECGVRLEIPCPSCNTPNAFSSAFCRHCGASLRAELAAPAPPSPPPPSAPACPRCRSVNEPGAAFCYSCGLPFDERREPGAALLPPGRPAGFWVRVAGWVIDTVLLAAAQLALVALWPGLSISEHFLAEEPAWTKVDWVVLVGNVLYYTLGLSIWATTIGKRVMGIYVLRPDGSKLGPVRAFARYLAYVVSALPFLFGYLMVAIRRDKRALHDLICDTVVVYRR